MKKIIAFLLVIVIFTFLGFRLAALVTKQLPQDVQRVAAFTPTATPTPTIAQPMTLTIPKLNVHSSVEAVGLDSAGRMDVPKGVGDTGWYSLGAKPGETGNAVIDGHFDTPTGAPSVFYYIGNLTPGDIIQVTDVHNKIYTFTVTKITSFPDKTFPIAQVFGDTSGKHLNLITCSGTWDRATHNYSNRTVVFSTLLQK